MNTNIIHNITLSFYSSNSHAFAMIIVIINVACYFMVSTQLNNPRIYAGPAIEKENAQLYY